MDKEDNKDEEIKQNVNEPENDKDNISEKQEPSENNELPSNEIKPLNEEDAINCKLCFYQLQKPSFQQDSGPNQEITNDLFDELLGDFDEEESEEIIDWSKTTFQIDDVTIDVQQYDDDDGIIVSQNPSFALTVDHPEPTDEVEEDYVLKPEDAPEFVTKFEMPDEEVKEFKEITYKPVELVQPVGEDLVSETLLQPEPEPEP